MKNTILSNTIKKIMDAMSTGNYALVTCKRTKGNIYISFSDLIIHSTELSKLSKIDGIAYYISLSQETDWPQVNIRLN